MNPYDHHWRTQTRPAILGRDCHRCVRCGRPWRLEIAHLDGDPANNDPANLATLCRTCHRAHDYPLWAARCRNTRGAKKDAARPLLEGLTVA